MGFQIILREKKESHGSFQVLQESRVCRGSRPQLLCGELQCRTNITPRSIARPDELHQLKAQQREVKSLVVVQYLEAKSENLIRTMTSSAVGLKRDGMNIISKWCFSAHDSKLALCVVHV